MNIETHFIARVGLQVVVLATALVGAILLAAPLAPPLAAIDATTYPREIISHAGKVLVHHPVISDWTDFETLTGKTPLEVTLRGSDTVWLGTSTFEVDTEILHDRHLVKLNNPRIMNVQFPDDAPQKQILALVREAVKMESDTVVLDFLVRALPDDFRIPGADSKPAHLSFDPPRIVVANRPTRLLLIDGPPAMSPIESTALEIVINSNWEIYHHRQSDQWYLLDGEHWLTNTMLAGGDWRVASKLPTDFFNLQYATEWEHLAAVIPPRPADSAPLPFVISYESAELMLIDGQEAFEAVPGTLLEVLKSSNSDIFRYEHRYYLLITGRWFDALGLKKNWNAVRRLPAEFARIPPDYSRAHVLASVPGTPEARVAVIEAALPRTVRGALGHELGVADGISVNYLGPPSFVPIENTVLRRAENTPYQVIQHNNFYYLCHEGAWYLSDKPDRGWTYAVEVPEAIYTIPPTDPAFNVTFVRVKSFDDSSGQVAYSHTQSYRGSYWTGSSIVYGTGWYYPPYVHRYGYGYPYYWHQPYGYGYGARYNSAYGGYYPVSSSYSVGKPDLDKDWEWGLDGSKRQITGQQARNHVGGSYRTSSAASAIGTRSELASQNNGADDLYSGSDGNVYRRTAKGWQRHENGQWRTLGGEAQHYLEQQYQARETGYRNYAVQRNWDYPGDK